MGKVIESALLLISLRNIPYKLSNGNGDSNQSLVLTSLSIPSDNWNRANILTVLTVWTKFKIKKKKKKKNWNRAK